MSEEKPRKKISPVTTAELTKLRDAISARYGLKLRPGEAMTIDAVREPSECWARIDISTIDGSYQLEIECAALEADLAASTEWDVESAFTDVLDMVDVQLGEYFENDRFAHFHDDWRAYEFEGAQLRLRGAETRPSIDALADAWLAANGEPDDTDGESN